MQTSQVSNAANMLTTSPAPNKQADANAASEPFGQVLSREVSQRGHASEASKGKESGKPAPAQGNAKSPAKANEAKQAKESKSPDKAQAEEQSEEAASALPDEMLALVANLAELNTPTTTATNATAPAAAVTTDAASVADTAALPSALVPAGIRPADAAMTGADAATGTMTGTNALDTPGKDLKADIAATQLNAGGKDNAIQTDTPIATPKTDTFDTQLAAQSKTQDFAAKAGETLNVAAAAMQPVQQQAGIQAVQQSAAAAMERLTPRVGTPAWDQALGQKVVWMVAGEQQSASLTLNPPDLGPLQVVLNVSNSQANATFIAAQPEVRQALEAAMPKLRDMLGEAGIQLGQASVNSGEPNQQGGFDQQASQSTRGLGHAGDREHGAGEGATRTTRVQPSTPGRGLVDTFA